MRHEIHCPGQRAFEGQQTQLQLQPVTTELDAKAKAMIEFQNAMFAAAFCQKANGRCEECGQ